MRRVCLQNIVVSSGAASSECVRTPHAVASLLACAMGMSCPVAARLLASNAAAAVAHGVARRALVALGPGAGAVLLKTGPVSMGKQQGRSRGHRRGGAVAVVPLAVFGDLMEGMEGAEGMDCMAPAGRKASKTDAAALLESKGRSQGQGRAKGAATFGQGRTQPLGLGQERASGQGQGQVETQGIGGRGRGQKRPHGL